MIKYLLGLWIVVLVLIVYVDGAVIGQQQALIRRMMMNPACNGVSQ